jgi:hypothetical protein
MVKKQRRQSQNSRLMRDILDHLREYDVDEIKLLCERYVAKHSKARRTSSRRRVVQDDF